MPRLFQEFFFNPKTTGIRIIDLSPVTVRKPRQFTSVVNITATNHINSRIASPTKEIQSSASNATNWLIYYQTICSIPFKFSFDVSVFSAFSSCFLCAVLFIRSFHITMFRQSFYFDWMVMCQLLYWIVEGGGGGREKKRFICGILSRLEGRGKR